MLRNCFWHSYHSIKQTEERLNVENHEIVNEEKKDVLVQLGVEDELDVGLEAGLLDAEICR